MNIYVRPLIVIILVILLRLPSHAQISKEHLQVCRNLNSPAALAYCPVLDTEFSEKRIAGNAYGKNETLFNPMVQIPVFTAAVLKRAYKNVLLNTLSKDAKAVAIQAIQAEANSIAQTLSTKATVPQTGAGDQASGTTSLVAKPTTTDLISLAAESGAFTDTVNGATLTAQVNANGLRRYLSNQPFSTLNPSTADFLQHLTLAATFNIAQGGTTVPTTGEATAVTPSNITSVLLPSNNLSFSSIGVNFAVFRPYTPTSSKFASAWSSAIAANQKTISTSSTSLAADFTKAVPSQASVLNAPAVSAAAMLWQKSAADHENANDFKGFVEGFVVFFDAVVTQLETSNTFDQDILNSAADISQLQAVRNTILDSARGSLITLSYKYSTPSGQPAVHNAAAVLAYVSSKRDPGAQVTLNAAGSWFATVPPQAQYGRVKDYQFSGQFDQPIGVNRSSPRAIFSVAGYGQYQYSANVLNVTVANLVPGTDIAVPPNSQVFVSTPGWVGIAQGKLTFNIGKGTTIPVAIKWSNKTDLLTDSNWRGQFGFSYDLSALAAILNPK